MLPVTRSHCTRSRRAAIARAALEALESRCLLTVTINTAEDFATLAAADGDGDNTLWTVNDDLVIQDGGSVNANDDWVGSIPNSSAQSIRIQINGDLTIEEDTAGELNTGIFAENRNQGGTGGDITINVTGNITLENRAVVSSSRIGFSNANPQNAGDIELNAGLNVDLQTGSIVAANDEGGRGGDILITSDTGRIDVDGLVSSGPTTTVLNTKLNGFVLAGGATTQQGGDITIKILSDTGSADPNLARLVVSTTGVIVSQGQDPASGKILLESQCSGILINGLVASVSKKGNGTLTNAPIVEVRSPRFITINAQDLGGVGPNQGRVRADYIIGEAPEPHGVDLFARADVTINGPAAGAQAPGDEGDGGVSLMPVFAVSANGGHATNQIGGDIRVYAIGDPNDPSVGSIIASGQALQADARPGGGSDGGVILLHAINHIDLDGALVWARGDFDGTGGYGKGGTLYARAYKGSISWTNGQGDVRPTGDDPAPPPTLTDPGTITLVYATTLDTTGTSFPTGGTVPDSLPPLVPFPVTTQDNTFVGTELVLPNGVLALPVCIGQPNLLLDWGDNPDPLDATPGLYPTLALNDGARHIVQNGAVVNGYYLGSRVDVEADGQPDINAKGDDNNSTLIPPGAGSAGIDDEDGVDIESNMTLFPGKIGATVNVVASKAGVLNAWIDWNRDGDFADIGEQVATMLNLVAGNNVVVFNVPVTAVVDVAGAITYSRWRFSDDGLTPDNAAPLSWTGLSDTGEVEDHIVRIFPYWTSKCAVITQIASLTGMCWAIPDVLVDVDNGPAGFDVTKLNTLAPATKSIQAAINYVNANGGDLNGDGVILIAVTAKDTVVASTGCGGLPFMGRELGGNGYENFVLTNPFSKHFMLMGNSVNINAANTANVVATVQNSVGKVTYMDVHVYGSNTDGLLVKNNTSAVLVKNTDAGNNKGAGIHIQDNNVEVRGSQRIVGNGTGILAEGTAIVLSTNNVTKSTGWGIKILGGSNTSANNDVGASGAGNGLGGIYVEGSSNKLSDDNVLYNLGAGIVLVGNSNYAKGEDVTNNAGAGFKVTGNTNKLEGNNIFSNTGIGIDLAGNTNTLLKNVVGDKNKGNTGHGVYVNGASNVLQENKSIANGGYGFFVTGGTSATYNTFKNNLGGNSGGALYVNSLGAYHFVTAAIKDLGGNKKNGASVTLGTFVASKDF